LYGELRQEFDRMVKENRTPREYGLKVRTHPAGLRITAANKMRNTRRFMLSYADTIVETYAFHKDPMIKQKNLAVIERWVQNIGNPSDSDDDRSTVWHNIIIHPDVRSCNQALLKTFIERQTEHGLLTDWIVALISSGKNETHRMTLGGIEDIGLTYRRDTTREDATKYTLSRNRLIDPKDEGIGLTEEQKATALILTNSWRPEGAPAAKTASGQAYRHLRGDTGQGLLLIYPVTPIDQSASQSGESDVSVPFVGLALSFPRMPNGMPIQYDANVIFSPGDYAVAMEDGE
ncbi:MAG: Z1 domain-containing protein, partial [Thaumarchaeota archaeon]|nr:Z1 domain-containing protein [Nitrososphaerota archaeon]